MKKTCALLFLIIIGISVSSCSAPEIEHEPVIDQPKATLGPENILVLADVSGNAAWTIEHFQPLADYLANNLAEFGIQEGKVVVTKDLPTMMDYLESGQVDLYFDSPFPALEVYEKIGAQPLVRRWKGGRSEYHTLIVANTNSGISDLDGLLGQAIAFDHPASTSGFLLPKAHLTLNGFNIVERDDVNSQIKEDEIGYIFAYGDENVLAWVLQGKTAGAAIPNHDYENLDSDQKSQVVILAETPSVPRHIALASPEMEPELVEKITNLLLEIDQTTEGQSVLESFEETSKFDELPNGPEEAMEALKDLFAPVRE